MFVKHGNTNITVNNDNIEASRLINNNQYHIKVSINDIDDLLMKFDRVINLSDEDFKLFDEIRRNNDI